MDKDGTEKLPGAALNWVPLFHVQRAGALLGAVGLVGFVFWHTSHERLPLKVGPIEFAKEAVGVTADAIEKLNRRIDQLEEALGIRSPSERGNDES
ncbi:hypothetical protein OJ997_05660 [Solirubrobacter phytolaccae]|uniref:Uncharacterized protein n=1 Tax=Solirubrobacter phytolaccae TaxID=1404360 RepID=A0A9X3N8X4_9ACTN|nr:hypothetical protein [Solirubrobacter phytolaccae]MDA0179771.1 hypothetical protein [Solirubrobacter phytolaccae]